MVESSLNNPTYSCRIFNGLDSTKKLKNLLWSQTVPLPIVWHIRLSALVLVLQSLPGPIRIGFENQHLNALSSVFFSSQSTAQHFATPSTIVPFQFSIRG